MTEPKVLYTRPVSIGNSPPSIPFDAILVRVYFNRKETPKKAWSVDTGEGTVEHCCSEVLFGGVSGVTRRASEERGPEPDHDSPRAWLEIRMVHVEMIGSKIGLSPSRIL
jgi:hypothetical protein